MFLTEKKLTSGVKIKGPHTHFHDVAMFVVVARPNQKMNNDIEVIKTLLIVEHTCRSAYGQVDQPGRQHQSPLASHLGYLPLIMLRGEYKLYSFSFAKIVKIFAT